MRKMYEIAVLDPDVDDVLERLLIADVGIGTRAMQPVKVPHCTCRWAIAAYKEKHGIKGASAFKRRGAPTEVWPTDATLCAHCSHTVFLAVPPDVERMKAKEMKK